MIESWPIAKALRYYKAAIDLLQARNGVPEKRDSKLARDADAALDSAFAAHRKEN